MNAPSDAIPRLAARVLVVDANTSGFTLLEAATLVDHRWWSAAEIRSSPETIWPLGLADLLDAVAADRVADRSGAEGAC